MEDASSTRHSTQLAANVAIVSIAKSESLGVGYGGAAPSGQLHLERGASALGDQRAASDLPVTFTLIANSSSCSGSAQCVPLSVQVVLAIVP